MKSKKIFLFLFGIIVISIASYYLYQYFNKKYEEEKNFHEQLDFLVKIIEKRKWSSKLSPAEWYLTVDIPTNVEYESWSEENELPRLLFIAKRSGEKYNNIYSMNLNGTDVKLIATYEDFGGTFWPREGINKPSRSPNGRYIITTSLSTGFWCTLYDIKERKSTKFAPHDCRVDYWSPDSKTALISNSGKNGYLDVESKEIEFFEDIYGDDFEKANGRFFTIESERKIISKIKDENDYTRNIPGEGDQIVYEIPGFKNPIRVNYLPKECIGGGYYSADRNYFTCDYDRRNKKYSVYKTSEPNQVVHQSFGFWVIQPGKWGFQDEMLYRTIDENENSVFKSMYYYYKANDEYEMVVYDDIYISKNLLNDFDEVDLGKYFPRLPTDEDYDKSYNKMTYGGVE